MDKVKEKVESISFEQLIFAIETLLNAKYSEVEDHREDLNLLDVLGLAASSLMRDVSKSTGPYDESVNYKIEKAALAKLSGNFLLWNEMIDVFLQNISNESISKDSQNRCCQSLLEMVKYSLGDSQLFSIIFSRLKCILKVFNGQLDPKNEPLNEMIDELAEKLGIDGTEMSFEQIVNYWDTNRDAIKLIEAVESKNLPVHREELGSLFNICYRSWRELVSVDGTRKNSEIIIESIQIGNKLVILSECSDNVIESIERMFQLILYSENAEHPGSYITNFIFPILDAAFTPMREILVRVKSRSYIPNSLLKLILSILSTDSRRSIQLDAVQFIQHIPAGVARLVTRSNIGVDQFQEITDLVLIYGSRCLERNICPSMVTLWQFVIDNTSGKLDYSIARDSLKLMATCQRSVLSSQIEEIFQAVEEFTNLFHHSSIKSRKKSIRSLLRFSREILLVGDDPIQILKSVLALVLNDNQILRDISGSQNIGYSINCLIEGIRLKLIENSIAIRDIIHTIMPAISRLITEQSGISNLNRIRSIIDCSSILIRGTRNVHDFRILLDYALPLIDFTLPREDGVKQVYLFFRNISARFLYSNSAYLLQFAQTTAERLNSRFPQETGKIRTLFHHLLTEGSLGKISFIYIACQKYVFDIELVAPLHIMLYNQAYPTEIFSIFAEITTALSFIHENEFGNTSQDNCGSSRHLIGNFAKEIFEKTNSKDISLNIWEDLSDKAMLSVFIFLAIKEDNALDEYNVEEQDLYFLLNDCTPLSLRQLIVSITKRIMYMHMEMYSPLKRNVIQLLVRAIYQNNSVSVPRVTRLWRDTDISIVIENIQRCISKDTFNRKSVESLVGAGYSRDIFRYNIQLQVQVSEGKRAASEATKSTLMRYKEFEYLLKSFYVSALWFSHSKVLVCDLLEGDLSPQQVEARLRYAKMHLLKWINKRYVPAYHLKTVRIFENERNNINSHPQQRLKDKSQLTITVLTQFSDTILSCSDTIMPSFLEFGAHNEVPLEIAIRQDRALVSVRNSHSNEEIESCQVVFTREGVYVMESTARCPGVDTTPAWCQLFTALLTTDRLVPSVILPRGHPNADTWSHLNQMVQTECLSSHLTWCPFYSYEWVTHYSCIPKKVQAMSDIVLHPGFRDSKGMCQNMSPVWHAQTDIVGVVFPQVLTHLSKTYLSSVYCSYSECIYNLISGYLIPSGKTDVVDLPNSVLPTFLDEDVIRVVDSWILSTNLDKLFVSNRKIFLELKQFLDRNSKVNKYKHVRTGIRRIIADSFHFFVLSDLPIEIQEASMLWIEQVDDSLWNEMEKLDDRFRDLLKVTDLNAKLFPGFVCFFLPEYKQTRSIPKTIDVLSPDKLCGYIVGKTSQFAESKPNGTKEYLFDAWGTWIDPKFRKLGIAINFYRYALRLLPTKYLELEMKEGFNLKCADIVRTGCFLTWFGVLDLIMNRFIVKEEASKWNFYLAADERRFKRYIFDVKALRPFVYVDTAVNYCGHRWSRFRINMAGSSYIRLIGLTFILITMLIAIL